MECGFCDYRGLLSPWKLEEHSVWCCRACLSGKEGDVAAQRVALHFLRTG